MWKFLKAMLRFRVGQKASRGIARSIGLGGLAGVIGLVGGVKSMRRHRT